MDDLDVQNRLRTSMIHPNGMYIAGSLDRHLDDSFRTVTFNILHQEEFEPTFRSMASGFDYFQIAV